MFLLIHCRRFFCTTQRCSLQLSDVHQAEQWVVLCTCACVQLAWGIEAFKKHIHPPTIPIHSIPLTHLTTPKHMYPHPLYTHTHTYPHPSHTYTHTQPKPYAVWRGRLVPHPIAVTSARECKALTHLTSRNCLHVATYSEPVSCGSRPGFLLQPCRLLCPLAWAPTCVSCMVTSLLQPGC